MQAWCRWDAPYLVLSDDNRRPVHERKIPTIRIGHIMPSSVIDVYKPRHLLPFLDKTLPILSIFGCYQTLGLHCLAAVRTPTQRQNIVWLTVAAIHASQSCWNLSILRQLLRLVRLWALLIYDFPVTDCSYIQIPEPMDIILDQSFPVLRAGSPARGIRFTRFLCRNA